MRKVAVFVCLTILCSGVCLAQRGGGRRGGVGRGIPLVENEDETIDLFNVYLGLNDQQPQKLRSILDAALAEAMPLRKPISLEGDPLLEAAKSGKSDEEIAKIAAEQANAAAQMRALSAKTFAKIYRMLTPEQQAKAGSFLYERLGELLESGQPSAPAPAAKQ